MDQQAFLQCCFDFRRHLQPKITLRSARARGRVGGRKPKLTKQQVQVMKTLYESEEHTVEKIVEQFGIHRNTFYGYRAKWLKA